MIVRCIAEKLSEEQAHRFSFERYRLQGGQSFNLRLGQEYVVYGITIMGGEPWVEIASVFEYVYSVPLCLFEIVDGRVSRHWEARWFPSGTFALWPPSFYQEYYHDFLSDGDPAMLEDFRRVRALIDEEARQNLASDSGNT